jgi:antitoxin VapB
MRREDGFLAAAFFSRYAFVPHGPESSSCKKRVSRLCISQLDIRQDDAMTSSTVFTSNRSQAVRLPKAVAFPEDVHQVDILKIGRSRVIVPQGKRWDDLFQNGPRASEDFMVEREQPPAEEREQL